MDDDERPRRRSTEGDFGAASLLSSESLEADIERIRQFRDKSAAHMAAANSLFRSNKP
jgi:uncharacterized small protein (DUF1192 family)